MKSKVLVAAFLSICVSILFIGVGCEDKPDTDNVDGFFDGRDISADTRTPTRSPQRTDDLGPAPDPLEELVIQPLGREEIDGDGKIVELTLAADGEIVALKLLGASGSVTWSVSVLGRGDLVTKSNTGATYRRDSSGDNVVTAQDATGRKAFKVIKQP
ncbi:MAG: hypothetical protein ACNA71_04210 [Kiritimatiellia bacterium]